LFSLLVGMAASTPYLDSLVKEYLLFRGFTATLRAFDAELKSEKEKGFRVDRIVDQLSSFINSHDLGGLLDLWRHLDSRIFTRLEASRVPAVRKLENSLLKLYAVTCVSTKQAEKLKEFFERIATDVHGQQEWKDWFALPWLKDPQDNPAFSLYFTRQWQDTLMLSLHNFLALVFQALPQPRLADMKKTASRQQAMREEIRQLKLRLADSGLAAANTKAGIEVPLGREVMDDFYLIAQETAVVDNQVKTLKSFLRTITGGGRSPSSSSASTSLSKSRSSSRSRYMPAVTTSSSTSTTTSKGTIQAAGTSSTNNPASTNINSSSAISKQPLKRVTQSVNPLAGLKSAAGGEVEKELEANEEQNDDTRIKVEVTDPEADKKSHYLVLGQEEYKEHRAPVSLISLSSVGGNIASCDSSGVIKVWSSSPSPATLATFISGSPVSSLVWLAGSERYLVYGTTARQLRLCDVVEKTAIAEAGDLPGIVSVLLSLPTSLLLCCAGPSILILDKALKIEQEFKSGSASTTAAASNHNGTLLIHGSETGQLAVTDLNKGELLSSWQPHSSTVVQLCITADETSVWSLGKAGTLVHSSLLSEHSRLWEAKLEVGVESSLAFCLAPDSDHFLIGTGHGAALCKVEEGSQSRYEEVLAVGSLPWPAVGEWGSGDCGPVLVGGDGGILTVVTLLKQ